MNEKEAIQEAVKAARGNASAQHNLAFMYNNGTGVTKDYKQAFKWYTKSAEQGNATAQYNLGTMYNKGLGVTKDYEQSDKEKPHYFGKKKDKLPKQHKNKEQL